MIINRYGNLSSRLELLNPTAILSRGYSITRTIPEKQVVRSAKTVSAGQELEILLGVGFQLFDDCLGVEQYSKGNNQHRDEQQRFPGPAGKFEEFGCHLGISYRLRVAGYKERVARCWLLVAGFGIPGKYLDQYYSQTSPCVLRAPLWCTNFPCSGIPSSWN